MNLITATLAIGTTLTLFLGGAWQCTTLMDHLPKSF